MNRFLHRLLTSPRTLLLGTGVLATLGLDGLALRTEAQPFLYQNNDLCLCFRKNAPYTENYEVVVNLGQAANYLNTAVGTTIPVAGYSGTQLAPASFVNLGHLSWSVFGWYSGTGFGTGYPANTLNTLWVSVARNDVASRSEDPSRSTFGIQRTVRGKIVSIFSNAAYVSHDLSTANDYNTPTFVREPIAAYGQHLPSLWLGGLVDNTVATLNDTWPPSEPNGGNLENTTPDPFSQAVRSDLYEVRPLADSGGNALEDPKTGMTGLAHYVGYFELKPDGSMTFTREEAGSVVTPPSPPVLTVTREGTTTTISFISASKATYRLIYNGPGGLTAPAATWPAQPGTITGDGTKKSFQDTTGDAARFYRVVAE